MKKLSSVLLAALFFCGQLSAFDTYTVEQMHNRCLLKDTNEHGQSVGFFENFWHSFELYRYDPDSGYEGLNIVSDWYWFRSPIINNQGQIALDYFVAGFKPHYYIFFYDPVTGIQHLTPPKDERWKDQKMKVKGFNDLGQILVINQTHFSSYEDFKPFAIWENSRYTVYNMDHFVATALNNKGEILGKYKTEENKHIYAIYDPAHDTYQMIDLSTLPTSDAWIMDFNDRGAFIGRYIDRETKNVRGFFWSPEEGLKILEDFQPSRMNNKDQVVGWKVYRLEYNYFISAVWEKGQVKMTHELLDKDAGYDWLRKPNRIFIYDINDQGVLSGAAATNSLWSYKDIKLTPKAN